VDFLLEEVNKKGGNQINPVPNCWEIYINQLLKTTVVKTGYMTHGKQVQSRNFTK
jgi:hypothetical protein